MEVEVPIRVAEAENLSGEPGGRHIEPAPTPGLFDNLSERLSFPNDEHGRNAVTKGGH